MTIKIKAPRAWTYPDLVGTWNHRFENCVPIRIVRESDWRKLMKLVKVVDEHTHADPWKTCDICEALAALSKEKKK